MWVCDSPVTVVSYESATGLLIIVSIFSASNESVESTRIYLCVVVILEYLIIF